jgi:4-amino-4-deoxy-L-arabinose transferase-like glycosyltransferase
MLYEYKKPLTNSAPLYSLLLAVLYSFPDSDIILHALQLVMLGISSWLVYLMLKPHTGKYPAAIAGFLVTLFPGNLIYAASVMSETGIQLFYTLYIYLLWKYLNTRSVRPLSISVFLGFAMGLWKYPYIIFGPLSLAILLYRHPKQLSHYLFPALGIALILVWIFIHHRITGIYALSDFQNLRYNLQMMYAAKVLPQENDPSVVELRKYLPPGFDLRRPFWEFEPYLNPITGNDFAELDRLVGNVGKAAFFYHPDAFVKTAVYTFFKMHHGDYPHLTPYSPSLAEFGNPNADYPNICDRMGTMRYCTPIISTSISLMVWNGILSAFNWFYAYIYPVWSIVLFFPALIYCLICKNQVNRLFGALFLIGRIPVVAFTLPHARYLLPFYPIMMMIIFIAAYDFTIFIRRKIRKRN